MPVAYYIIPMVAGPYSRLNPQRPDYVDEIQCNWTGHNVDELGVYICKVNTTEAKHTDLASRAGVRQLPRGATWDTVISTLPAAARNVISNWCNNNGIPYDASDTIGELLTRIISSGVLSLRNINPTTQYQNMTEAQRNKIAAWCQRAGHPTPANTDTLKSMLTKLGRAFWPGNDDAKVWVDEY